MSASLSEHYQSICREAGEWAQAGVCPAPHVLYQGYHRSHLHSIYCSQIGSFYQSDQRNPRQTLTGQAALLSNIRWDRHGHTRQRNSQSINYLSLSRHVSHLSHPHRLRLYHSHYMSHILTTEAVPLPLHVSHSHRQRLYHNMSHILTDWGCTITCLTSSQSEAVPLHVSHVHMSKARKVLVVTSRHL